MILTYKYRIKDANTAKHLNQHAWACNQVWNYCCQIQREAEKRWKAGRISRWPSAFDLTKLCAGANREFGLHSDTIIVICRRFVVARDNRKRCPHFRSSSGSKRSLGWIPFIKRAIQFKESHITYLKRSYRFWHSRDLCGPIKTGCFTQDARGRWYVALQCEVLEKLPTGKRRVGIDLGLKTLATCSNGDKIPALQHYRQYEEKLATAQRANNKRRAKTIHAKIANARRHHLHEQSTKIAQENELIVVGNVNAPKLAKTRMAKSVMDASWGIFRSQLAYKARRHNACYVEADERWTSQMCSCCGSVPSSSPKGMGALGIRHWTCSDCGVLHDRDTNAAVNILRVGLERQPLVVGISVH